MARNGAGVMSIPNPDFVNGTTADADQVDANNADLVAELTNSIAADGQTNPTANLPMATFRHTGVGNAAARTDYAAAGQVQDGKLNWVDGGGTADAITAAYSPAVTALENGQFCFVRATAANATTTPTFSPNGLTARTIVKTGGNALAAGDIVGDGHELALRYDLANTRWELLNPYTAPGISNLVEDTTPQLGGDLDANGNQIKWAKGADVVSATALPVLTDGNYFDVTGTTTITSIDTCGGDGTIAPVIKLHFDGALTLTHHATDLILPGGANITTAAGDEAEFVEYAAGDWRCTNYTKASGASVYAGKVVQIVSTQSGAVQTGTTTIPNDDTIPQNTEGDEYYTLAITPTSASNTLIIEAQINVGNSAAGYRAVALFQDATADALCVISEYNNATSDILNMKLAHIMTAGTTSSTTFKIRAGMNGAGTTTINGFGGVRKYGGVLISSVRITEYAA